MMKVRERKYTCSHIVYEINQKRNITQVTGLHLLILSTAVTLLH